MLRHLMARISRNIATMVQGFTRASRGPRNSVSSQPQGAYSANVERQDGGRQAPMRHVIFDISDLVQFLRESRVPTGIQRVQLNVIHYAIKNVTAGLECSIVYFEKGRNDWLHLTMAEFQALHRATEANENLDEEAFLAVLEGLAVRESLRKKLATYPPQDQFILVNLGTSWWIENYFLKLRELRNHCSLCYVPMIHDCIPLMVPEHCGDALVEDFRSWFAGVCLEADAVMTNSQWSGNDIRRELMRLDPGAALPVHPIALNGDMSRHLAKRSQVSEDLLRHILPHDGSFVLCVATLESRKNHILLFKAWQRLIESHGAASVPYLLCLGRAGWLFEEAAEFLRANPALNERILLVSSVSDTALGTLYEKCLFSVFNSFYEGWGLPITESLSFGALPLVASNTSLTEAGGDAAVYFRGDDLADLHEKLEMLIFDKPARERLRDHARATAQIREWSAIADEMLQRVSETKPSALLRQKRFLDVPAGSIISLGKTGADTPFHLVALGSLVRDGLNWHRPEDWGCWTMPGTASMRLRLPDHLLGKVIAFFIRLRGSALPTRMKISVFAEYENRRYGPMERVIGSGKRLVLCFNMRATHKEIRLDIDCGAGTSLGPGDRDVGVGVTHIMVCDAKDPQAHGAFMAAFPELSQASWVKRRRSFQKIEVPNI